MKLVVLNTDYDSFLAWHYGRTPGLAEASYARQLEARVETLFGLADFYSRNFHALGHTATEIYVNNLWLQTAWAREHGLKALPEQDFASRMRESDIVVGLKRRLRAYRSVLSPLAKRVGLVPRLTNVAREILLAQIEELNPDVILNQELGVIGSDIMAAVRRKGRVLIAQCGVEPPGDLDLSPYDFGISLIPWVVDYFRKLGLRTEHFHLAFDSSVLERLGPAPAKDLEVSFVGGLGADHARRIQLLEAIAERFPVALWLSTFKGIRKDSPLHRCYRGEAWGREMYEIIRRSKITLNSHIDASRGSAGNMRLYEATGVGTFLLTDNLADLGTLFRPGEHVGAYDSVDDCLSKIALYLKDEPARQRIAEQGQRHTLANHTYRRRAAELLDLIAKYGT